MICTVPWSFRRLPRCISWSADFFCKFCTDRQRILGICDNRTYSSDVPRKVLWPYTINNKVKVLWVRSTLHVLHAKSAELRFASWQTNTVKSKRSKKVGKVIQPTYSHLIPCSLCANTLNMSRMAAARNRFSMLLCKVRSRQQQTD